MNTVTRVVAGCSGLSDGGDMDGGEELRPWWGSGLQRGNGETERGNGAGAHGGLDGVVRELGDAVETVGQRR